MTEAQKWRFRIELQNQNDGQGHSWVRTAKSRKRLWTQISMEHGKRTPFECRVDIIITRLLGPDQRLWDPDSIGRGNAKQFMDALVACGWFFDDSAKWIRNCDYRQDDTQRSQGPAIELTVFPLEEFPRKRTRRTGVGHA